MFPPFCQLDYEYKRNGTANLFMLFAPLEGWRHVEVTGLRTAIDQAKIVRDLADIHFPKAEKIVLVQDNLNTHTPASLYEAFEPAEARRIIESFEWHYTPKHGSWLNGAKSELAVLSSQCVARRTPDAAKLKTEVDAWQIAISPVCPLAVACAHALRILARQSCHASDARPSHKPLRQLLDRRPVIRSDFSSHCGLPAAWLKRSTRMASRTIPRPPTAP